MQYDFDIIPDRGSTGSTKWDNVGADISCVPLSVADMEFPTARPIKDAIKDLAENTILGYTHETDDYYDAVISWQKRRHDFDVKKEWIVTTPGVVDALAVLIEAVTKPKDGVLILTPVYYPFDMAVIAKTRHIVYSTLINNNGRYEIDFADVEEKCKRQEVRALLFCNPHNPVGRVWTESELEKIGNICCDNGVFIIDDEIHNDLIMPGHKHTVMATINSKIKDNIAVCTAPSKTFNIAGLQCSNIIIPNAKAKAKAQACCLANMQLGLNIVGYTACKAAYNHCEDWLDNLLVYIDGNAKYVENFMAENFPEIKCAPLEGTYLQWLDMRGLGMTHVELKRMLEDERVYLDCGEMFGPAGRGYQRINIACARKTLAAAMERFKAGVEKVRAGWEKNGKPIHTPFVNGEKLKGFVYDSPRGRSISLEKNIRKTTLIVFARFFDCEICQEIMKTFKKAYTPLKLLGYELKFVLQDDVEYLAQHQSEYPFELIADNECRFYDLYNIFEAYDSVQMLCADKMFEQMIGSDIKSLLDSDMIDSIASSVLPGGEKPKHRENQLCAMVAVDKDMNILYHHYSKTISDFPNVKTLLKGLKA
ncbi:MAG: PatB family C-S lyase [Clostridiales bacterium]|nr:PatB family C-S lyase [Clostridiales bacterium]